MAENRNRFSGRDKKRDTTTSAASGRKQPALKKKFSFKEQREFEIIEKEMAQLDKERTDLTEQLSQPDLPFEKLQQLSSRINEINSLIDEKEMRWLEMSEQH